MKRCLRCFEQLDENTDTCPYCGYSENSCSGNDMYLAPGTLLSGRYTIGIVLEADSSNVTYAAWDNDSDLKVRIKEFFPDGYVTRSSDSYSIVPFDDNNKAAFDEGFNQFVEQARQMYNSAGSEKLYDCIAENGTAYMILEDIEALSAVTETKVAHIESEEYIEPTTKANLIDKIRQLPLWVKILIPSVIVVLVIGLSVALILRGCSSKKTDDPEETEKTVETIDESVAVTTESETSETEPAITVDADVMDYGGHSYACFNNADTWEAAEEYCESLEGHLAVITSQEENDAVWTLVRGNDCETVFIGLSDVNEEGNWQWVNGEPITYTNWAPGQPDAASPDENYGEFFCDIEGGVWNDNAYMQRSEEGGISFICEWDTIVRGTSNTPYEVILKNLPTPTPMPTPDPMRDVNNAYRGVLLAYEHALKSVEDDYEFVKSCSLTDLTGDGIPELLIQYSSDEETGLGNMDIGFLYAGIRIFTVIPGETMPTEMLCIPAIYCTNNSTCQVFLLSNGNLLIQNGEMSGDGESSFFTYTEYVLNGYSFQPENTLVFNDAYDWDADKLEQEYFYNDSATSTEEYNDYLSNYKSMLVSLISIASYAYSSPDWENAVDNTPDCSISFNEAWGRTGTNQETSLNLAITNEQAKQAFENYWSEQTASLSEDELMYYNFNYSEVFSDEHTCVYYKQLYLGAQCFDYTYYFMDLITGEVYTIGYSHYSYQSGESELYVLSGTTYNVFNGLDYIN